MPRRAGHESCRTCTTCGRSWCPDCEDDGVACTCTDDLLMLDEANPAVAAPRRRFVRNRLLYADPDFGSAIVEYALVITLAAVLLGIAVGFVITMAPGLRDQVDLPAAQVTQTP